MKSFNDTLFALAKRYRTRAGKVNNILRWYGRRQGSARRKYICYVCNGVIDTESSRYRITKHAEQAIYNHGKAHLDEHNLTAFL